MKRTLKKMLVVGVFALSGLGLVACSPKKEGGSGAEGKKIMFWNSGTTESDKAIVDYAVKKFNENNETGYTIVSVPTQNDNYKEKLVVAMSSGEAPDMYTSWSGGPMNEYIDSGFGQPLDDLYEEYHLKDILMEAAVAQSVYEDKIYAVPWLNISLAGIYYNTEIFAKYNLEVPKTVGELEKVADALKEHDLIPFALANAPKWTGSMFYQLLAARKSGLETFRSAVDGSGTFEDESFIYAGDKIIEWVKKDYFPEGANSLSEDDGQARQLMYQDKAAMALNGSWYIASFIADSPEFYEKIGWFPFPAIEGSEADTSIQIGTFGDQFITFNMEGEKLKAGFEFSTHLLDEDTLEVAIANGKLPPVKNIASYMDANDQVQKDILTAATDASSVQLWYDQYLPPAVSQTHLDTSQELFGLTKTSKEVAKEMQASMQEYLATKK